MALLGLSLGDLRRQDTRSMSVYGLLLKLANKLWVMPFFQFLL